MKTLIFQGYSDDTFTETTTGESFDNCSNGVPIQFKVMMRDGSGIIVTGCYGTSTLRGDRVLGVNCWMIGVQSIHESKPVDWKITIEPSFDRYRNRLTVEAPDESILSLINKEPEE